MGNIIQKVVARRLAGFYPFDLLQEETSVESANIVLMGKQQVKLLREPCPQILVEGLLVSTRASLISTAIECICYRSEMDEGSH